MATSVGTSDHSTRRRPVHLWTSPTAARLPPLSNGMTPKWLSTVPAKPVGPTWTGARRIRSRRCANVTGALIVREECLRRDVYLVHLSSGCLYEGDNGGQGYGEDDAPNFAGSFYAKTKIWAEQMLRDFPVLILRLRMPFDGSHHERNLLVKLARYSRVLTERNSLTCIPDFLKAARQLIDRRLTGIWNIVNDGALSPFELMQRYKQRVNPWHTFEPLPNEQLGEVTVAGRSNCLLSTAKLRAAGLALPPVEVAVERCLGELAGSLRVAV